MAQYEPGTRARGVLPAVRQLCINLAEPEPEPEPSELARAWAEELEAEPSVPPWWR
jgi:hypothetical protein